MKKLFFSLIAMFISILIFAKEQKIVKIDVNYKNSFSGVYLEDITPKLNQHLNKSWYIHSITPITNKLGYGCITGYVIVVLEKE